MLWSEALHCFGCCYLCIRQETFFYVVYDIKCILYSINVSIISSVRSISDPFFFLGLAEWEHIHVFPQVMPAEALTLEQQLAQYPLFNQLTAEAQAQLLSDLQKQQQALSQGIQLITLPTLASPGTASVSSPSPDSQNQTTASIAVNSVRRQRLIGWNYLVLIASSFFFSHIFLFCRLILKENTFSTTRYSSSAFCTLVTFRPQWLITDVHLSFFIRRLLTSP